MHDHLKNKIISGLVWRTLERFGTQAMGFVVSIILARLLEPKDFGAITLITVFIALTSVFVQGGFGTALIRKKEVTETDYNSVFYLSLVIACVLYGVLFVGAPWIAAFYLILTHAHFDHIVGVGVFRQRCGRKLVCSQAFATTNIRLRICESQQLLDQ